MRQGRPEGIRREVQVLHELPALAALHVLDADLGDGDRLLDEQVHDDADRREDDDGEEQRFTARHILLATGGQPQRPSGPGAEAAASQAAPGGGTGPFGAAGGPGSGPGGDPFDPGGGGTPPPPGDGDPTDDGICTAGENGTVCESENRPECERMPNASGECVTRFPTPTEWAALGETVARMTENTDYCRGAKAIAQGMYAAGRDGGRVVLWDGRNYEPGTNQKKMTWGRNDSDYRGRIIELDSYLAFAVRSLLAHEALHAYLNSINWPGSLAEQEAWVRGRESECAG